MSYGRVGACGRLLSGIQAVAVAILCAPILAGSLNPPSERAVRAAYDDVDPFLVNSAGCDALHPNVLIYNRVPKAGSTTMKYLLFQLSKRNGFQYVNKKIQQHYPSTDDLISHFDELCTETSRCVYVNHMRYPPAAALRRLAERNLTFALMNNVRRPLAQSRSHYEFVRFSRPSPMLRQQNQAEYNGSFSDCVHDAHSTCAPQNLYFKFFTHSEHPVEFDIEDMEVHVGSGTLLQAVVNIKSYALVGLVERWQESIAMFERIFPDFFQGAVEMQEKMDDRNRTPQLTQEADQLFSSSTEDARRVWYHSRFNIDNALYDYMATRFNKRFEACDMMRTNYDCATDEFLFEMM